MAQPPKEISALRQKLIFARLSSPVAPMSGDAVMWSA